MKNRYFGKGICNKNLLCYKIQKDKHQFCIKRTYNVLKTASESFYKEKTIEETSNFNLKGYNELKSRENAR